MSLQRLLLFGLALGLLMPSMDADAAGQYLEMRFERTRYRAMGGVDIVTDYTTPANGALGGGLRLTVLGIDAYATISEGRRAYRFGYDLWDTASPSLETKEDLQALQAQIENLGGRVKGSDFLLEIHSRVDFLNFNTNKGPWTFQIGAYSEGLGGARWDAPDQLEFVDQGENSYINIGSDQRLIRAGARLDTGVSFGVGRTIEFDENFRMAVGARVRGFYRVSLPEHAIYANAEIHGSNDIVIPREVRVDKGWGMGLDLFTTFHFNDDLTGFRVGAYVEDILTHVWREDKSFIVPPRMGVGLAWISPDGKFTIGSDLERIESFKPRWQPTWQIGMSYRAGSERFAIVPKAGFILNHRDIVDASLSPAITAGLELNVGGVHLATAFEFHTETRAVNAGLALSFGF